MSATSHAYGTDKIAEPDCFGTSNETKAQDASGEVPSEFSSLTLFSIPKCGDICTARCPRDTRQGCENNQKSRQAYASLQVQ